jgi:hypothetical protein
MEKKFVRERLSFFSLKKKQRLQEELKLDRLLQI